MLLQELRLRLRSSNNLDPILNPCSLSVDSNSVDDLL